MIELFEAPGKSSMYQYPAMTKTMRQKDATKTFILHVEAGSFTDSEIIVMLGENGTGKTTFIRMMAGLLKSDEQAEAEAAGDEALAVSLGVPQLNVRYVFSPPYILSNKYSSNVSHNSDPFSAISLKRSHPSSKAQSDSSYTRRSATHISTLSLLAT